MSFFKEVMKDDDFLIGLVISFLLLTLFLIILVGSINEISNYDLHFSINNNDSCNSSVKYYLATKYIFVNGSFIANVDDLIKINCLEGGVCIGAD